MFFQRDGVWQSLTWRECHEQVRRIADGLHGAGLQAEQRCIILAGTTVEWILIDMAILAAGGATTTVYPSATEDECAYVIHDSEAVIIFCDSDQLKKLRAIRDRIPQVKRIVVIGEGSSASNEISLVDLQGEGRSYGADHPNAYDEARRAITPERLATLMYTSGTTGMPKGVMLTHDAWIYEAEAVDALAFMNPVDKQLLFLPLAHVFAKVMEVSFIRLGIPTVVDGNLDNVIKNLRDTESTWAAAVPRVFEKAYNTIVSQAKAKGPVAYKTFRWALDIGAQVSDHHQKRTRAPAILRMRHAIADQLVLRGIRKQLGGHVRFFISGGAPLDEAIARFFGAIGILVLEGYGLTESSAASCVNRIDDYRFGSVGRPLPGCEVRIAEDGEILIRSRGVMQGYHNAPEATARVLDEHGWLYTGDLGVILPGEHVKITGRKKDLIVTAGGKNIAPANFEGMLKTKCSVVSQVVMHGDRRPYCVALIALDTQDIAQWARGRALAFTDHADLMTKSEVLQLVQTAIDKVNHTLPSFEQVKTFALLPEEPSRENGLLTATLKVKRGEVQERWADVLDAFYSGTVETL